MHSWSQLLLNGFGHLVLTSGPEYLSFLRMCNLQTCRSDIVSRIAEFSGNQTVTDSQMSHNEAPTRQVRPLVLFTGETNYCQWIDHFENVTVVNGWDKAAKLPLQVKHGQLLQYANDIVLLCSSANPEMFINYCLRIFYICHAGVRCT